jgi:hypothetical protein
MRGEASTGKALTSVADSGSGLAKCERRFLNLVDRLARRMIISIDRKSSSMTITRSCRMLKPPPASFRSPRTTCSSGSSASNQSRWRISLSSFGTA